MLQGFVLFMQDPECVLHCIIDVFGRTLALSVPAQIRLALFQQSTQRVGIAGPCRGNKLVSFHK